MWYTIALKSTCSTFWSQLIWCLLSPSPYARTCVYAYKTWTLVHWLPVIVVCLLERICFYAFVVRLFVCVICMRLLFVLWLPDWCGAGKLGIPLTGITPACWASPPSSSWSSSLSSRTIRSMIIHTGSKQCQPVPQSKKCSDYLWAIKINFSVEYSLSSDFDVLCRT